RVLDAGQCNDSYSLVVIAQALAKAFGVGINELPVSYNIAWYEQKAVLVLLALLSLGVKDITLGPKLPAFISPAVLDVLVKEKGFQHAPELPGKVLPILGVEDGVVPFLCPRSHSWAPLLRTALSRRSFCVFSIHNDYRISITVPPALTFIKR
ncbi:MAG TPA: hypothetical protein PKN85_02530, partial [Syntrophorhabdaceae bacterium]|nr:hypothetical protein [Syntrophorhabdaceae bacterium]